MKLNEQYRMIIKRLYLKDRTLGVLSWGDIFNCCVLELPWLNNRVDKSCISGGIYLCRKINSPAHGWCIEILDVYGRTLLRMHSGNFLRDTKGCPLIGDGFHDLDGDGKLEVTNSVKTLKRLMAILPDEFELVIGL